MVARAQRARPPLARTLALVLAGATLLVGCSGAAGNDRAAAIRKAKELYLQKKQAGTDILNGPCIAEYLLPDWVADIAHNPRQGVDDLAENQCQAYREGKARHFVELDPDGNLIRAQ